MNYPYLSLKNITIDTLLAQRIPRHLAYYHLALPIADDDDLITLVMVHPDNEKVRLLFEEQLGAKVFAVQGSGREIKATLDLLYPDEIAASTPRFLSWSANQPDSALECARTLAKNFSENAVCLDASQNSLETVLQIAQEGQYFLSVIDTSNSISDLLRKSKTSLLLLRGAEMKFEKILVALQGHSPDKRTLEMVAPLAKTAQVTILGVAAPMKRHTIQGISTLLNPSTEAGAHIAECADLLPDGYLKLRQGIPHEQIAAEFVEGDYDLLAIAVETYGGFVYRIVEAANNQNHILAVKPNLTT